MEPFNGFDWDDGNREKCTSHGLSLADVEHVLSHAETLIVPDEKHSRAEQRFAAIGRTASGRYAFVVFTPRREITATVLRPINGRYMHRKEIEKYAKEISRSQN